MSIRLMAVGDIALLTEPDGEDPFELVEGTLRGADLVFGNLEVPLTDAEEPVLEKAEPLRAPVERVRYLEAANVSVVNLASNHIMDYGATGVVDTIESLKRAGIASVGAGATVVEALREAVCTVRGRSVAFVGFYDHRPHPAAAAHIAGMAPQLVVHRVAELARAYDVVAVSLHWGVENVYFPSPEQQSLARACVEAGAAVLLGHHPHRFQGIEVYRGGVIFYSLGNFNFTRCGGTGAASSDFTAIADITVREDGAVSYDLIPVRIGDDHRPRPMTDPAEMADFRSHVERISGVLAAGVDKWWWFGEIGGPYLSGNLRAFGKRIRRYGLGHALEMAKWMFGRFALKCYVGLIRRWLSRRP